MTAMNMFTIDERPDLVPDSVLAQLRVLVESYPEIRIIEIDPQYSGGDVFCEHYGVPPRNGLNCVVVHGTRGEQSATAACLTPVGGRLRLNSSVRKHLGMRSVSMFDRESLLVQTGMEYGSVTPVGLPAEWHVLIPPLPEDLEYIVVGGGLQVSKLRLPPLALMALPNAAMLPDLLQD